MTTGDAETSVSVIDFRRHSMTLKWHMPAGTWTAHERPTALVHGIAYIRASPPNICLYGRSGGLKLQIGNRQYALSENSPRIKCSAVAVSLGLRRKFTVESSTGGMLFSHEYWARRRHDFFHWLADKAADPEWRVTSGRQWSEGVASSELRRD
jgi:hypothetical protein